MHQKKMQQRLKRDAKQQTIFDLSISGSELCNWNNN
jgi:hypothetical protein